MKIKMTLRTIAAATLAALAVGAQAAPLQTLAGTGLSIGGSGLQDVLFSVVTLADGTKVALGAHAYVNGAYLPNNGTNTFYANAGLNTNPAGNLTYANWSFDWAYSLGTCTTCQVFLRIDTDPTTPASFVEGNLSGFYGASSGNSWNLEMPFLGIAFDPFSQSSTAFELVVRDGQTNVGSTGITVNVPEPATLTLLGLGLAGLGFARRRKQQAA